MKGTTMPTKNTTTERAARQAKANAEFATQQVQDATDRTAAQLKEFGERTVGAGRVVGELALDAYEEAANALIEFE